MNKWTFLYLVLLIPSWFLWTYLWDASITDKFYHCSDPIGVDFVVPPFVHPYVHPHNAPISPYSDIEKSQQLLGPEADFYLNGMNETRLSLTWAFFFWGALATPAIVFSLFTALAAFCQRLAKR